SLGVAPFVRGARSFAAVAIDAFLWRGECGAGRAGKKKRAPGVRVRVAWSAAWILLRSRRAPYAGMTRIRFQGTLSTPRCGVPLTAESNLRLPARPSKRGEERSPPLHLLVVTRE